MTSPPINLETLYGILVQTARTSGLMSYEEVSQAYHRETDEWHEPHGTWNDPLGQINNILCSQQPSLPALSAVVTYKPQPNADRQPGDGFWGCCPCVPDRPSNEDQRMQVWSGILRDVYRTRWPAELPAFQV